MAHFAELDENNIVLRVVVVDDEHEADGENWCANFFGGGNWKQTSYNNRIRYNYAGIDYTFDPVADAFYGPQPYPSWVLDAAYLWQSPVPYPDDDGLYEWDEAQLNWVSL
jgi:hypothetical protein|tara:strand:+ start:134 stop:463 length:330 start_codon:yes stop_codon:yes gene_type:complete